MSNDYIGNIRTFETANFKVSVDAEYDWDVDLSFDESGRTRKDIDAGKLINFQVSVTVTHKASGMELGADYLGGCIYKSIQAFMDHRECGKQNRKNERKGVEGRCGSYFSDMIHAAIEEARKNRASLAIPALRKVA